MGYLAEGREIAGLSGSYTVERALPKSGFGQAFVGHDPHGARVLLKEVHVGGLDAWKRVDALEREARSTLHLGHSRIARFIELFVFDGEASKPPSALSRPASEASETGTEPALETPGPTKAPSLVLVRSFVEGVTVAEAIREKRRFTAVELEKIFRGLLETRKYLDTLLPAVVHGDVSPSNVVIDEAGEPWLIDFGAVAENVQGSPSAAVGTAGFMPPEQLAGRTMPASDLYAMAMTVLSAASHRAAHDMPIDVRSMQIPIDEVVAGLPKRFMRALSACLEPSLSARVRSADEALALLDAGSLTLLRAHKLATEKLTTVRAPAMVVGALLACMLPASLLALPMILRHKRPISVPTMMVPVVIHTPAEPITEVAPVTTADPEPGLVPAAASAAETTSITDLQWLGSVESAKGGLAKGALCVLTLAVDPSSTSCTVTLACEHHVVVDHEAVGDCSIAEIALNQTERVYRAAIAQPRLDGEASTELAFDDKRGLFRATRLSATGGIDQEVIMKVDGESVARTGPMLYPTQRFAKSSTFKGTVVRRSALGHVSVGDDCSYTLEPSVQTDGFDNDQNCHARIGCEGSVVYDGYGNCTLDGGGSPVELEDGHGSLIDGDPAVSVVGRELTVSDTTAKGQLSIVIYLESAPNPGRESE